MIRSSFVLCVAALCIASSAWCQEDRDYSRPPSRISIPADQRVDINHATRNQLLKVPGMTPSWADRILRFRPYRTKQDLIDDGILPDTVYYRIREYLIAHKEKPQHPSDDQ